MHNLKCTKENPYSEERDGPQVRWEHGNVIEIGDQKDGYPGGDIQRVKCLNCGLEWDVELSQ